ncbi:LPS export ABC transporter periplasmic protein LptC [uncultured Helicobacter sp.]|uniref:LPS export ABC transporter periplasmic protein LptC n=1 Tax=uncultured Helicobacter sp. TaxID=175537 RepID=UPI00260750CF|nr:LPS export ABC transporter periplasmic protein LptC [uncultured Helicobacter sp.]
MNSLFNPLKTFQSAQLVTFFFIFLCGFSIVMVLFLSIKHARITQAQQNISRFEVFNFAYFKITENGVNTIAKGKKAKENTNKESELESLEVKNLNNKTPELLQADLALYNNKDIFFSQGVTYKRDATKVWSEQARYSPESKSLEGVGEFIILDKNSKIRGRNLIYKNEKIHATNIYGILKENP